jgi:hypothetical protein
MAGGLGNSVETCSMMAWCRYKPCGGVLPAPLFTKLWHRKLELERGALGMLFDVGEAGGAGGVASECQDDICVVLTSLPGTFRRFAEWCDKVQWAGVRASS